MNHKEFAELINSFQKLSTFDEVASFWLRQRNVMPGYTTLFTFDEIGEELPLQSIIGNYDDDKFYLRSIFSKPNVYFLDDYIWSLMTGHGEAKFQKRLIEKAVNPQ